MALLELTPLNGTGEKIGDRGEEGDVGLAEAALFVGADAEDAVGTPVTSGDGRH